MSGKTVEIISGRERRRRWSVEDRLRMVAATYEPGACVRQVAASHEVYPGLLFAWRRQVRDGRVARSAPPVFLAVRATAAITDAAPVPRETANGRGAGQIEIERKDGSRVRVAADVSLASHCGE
jgi:transposase